MSYSGSIRTLVLVPHQDDETLSMGAMIAEHVAVNGPETVGVVLFTTGESSGVRRVLREVGYVPAGGSRVERVALSRRQFVASRDAEFYAACTRLGVPHGNIFMPGFTLTEDDGSTFQRGSYTTGSIPRLARFRDGVADRTVQQRRFTAAVDVVLAWFGPVHVKTISDHDPSQDHRLLGVALRSCSLPVGSRRYYFPPYRLDRLPRDAPPMYWHDARSAWLPALHEAGMAYGRWEPERGRFAVGWCSVGAFFGGPAGEMLRCPSRVPPATRAAECGRIGSVSAPNVPFFEHARTVMHL